MEYCIPCCNGRCHPENAGFNKGSSKQNTANRTSQLQTVCDRVELEDAFCTSTLDDLGEIDSDNCDNESENDAENETKTQDKIWQL